MCLARECRYRMWQKKIRHESERRLLMVVNIFFAVIISLLVIKMTVGRIIPESKNNPEKENTSSIIFKKI